MEEPETPLGVGTRGGYGSPWGKQPRGLKSNVLSRGLNAAFTALPVLGRGLLPPQQERTLLCPVTLSMWHSKVHLCWCPGAQTCGECGALEAVCAVGGNLPPRLLREPCWGFRSSTPFSTVGPLTRCCQAGQAGSRWAKMANSVFFHVLCLGKTSTSRPLAARALL